MEKCRFCMYLDGCIGELPGPDGRCMAFTVAKEDAAAYEAFLNEKEIEKKRRSDLFCASLKQN